MKKLHKLYDFMEARERLGTVIEKTKLIHSNIFSDESGNDVYIKPENLQRTGAFKIRGAYNKIAKLTEEEKKGSNCSIGWKSCTRCGISCSKIRN